MRFWDSSALVPLLVDEPSSEVVRELLDQDADVIIWMFTGVELLSALSRVSRQTRELSDLVPGLRFEALDLVKSCTTVADGDDVRRRAERLVGVHPLAAADALQLAAALAAANDRPEYLEFVTLDRVLAKSAILEGFRVLPARAMQVGR